MHQASELCGALHDGGLAPRKPSRFSATAEPSVTLSAGPPQHLRRKIVKLALQAMGTRICGARVATTR
jgi:hypothetical protein